ncbi:hypothetical protein SUDANB180_06533 [Streptomyces sp. enrichment culture]
MPGSRAPVCAVPGSFLVCLRPSTPVSGRAGPASRGAAPSTRRGPVMRGDGQEPRGVRRTRQRPAASETVQERPPWSAVVSSSVRRRLGGRDRTGSNASSAKGSQGRVGPQRRPAGNGRCTRRTGAARRRTREPPRGPASGADADESGGDRGLPRGPWASGVRQRQESRCRPGARERACPFSRPKGGFSRPKGDAWPARPRPATAAAAGRCRAQTSARPGRRTRRAGRARIPGTAVGCFLPLAGPGATGRQKSRTALLTCMDRPGLSRTPEDLARHRPGATASLRAAHPGPARRRRL